MGKVIRNFCWNQNFVPRGLSVPALGLYTCIKSFKMCLKSYFKEIVLKLATNGQSDKGCLLISTFVPKGLYAPSLGLYTCIKAFRYIPGPGVRWAFRGQLVLWFCILLTVENLCFFFLLTDCMFCTMQNIIELPHDKANKMACAPSEDSARPGHPPSLIRVFAVRSMGS